MSEHVEKHHKPCRPLKGLICRLARDRAGNVLAMAAAALFPLLAIIGGGIDMGRGYISQSRLQQACDSGVLAARKRLGTEAAVSGVIPTDAADTGNRFFNLNFRDGAYGTIDRNFSMTLEGNFAITGTATVNVPTTLMRVFGYDQMPVNVECQAQLNMANTDIMMVLDTTGSMDFINPGDSVTRMTALKSTVLNFHAQLIAAAPSTSRLRFGFVPYSTNVNVGQLLEDSWVNNSWVYQSREFQEVPDGIGTRVYTQNWAYESGNIGPTLDVSSYTGTLHPAVPASTFIDQNEITITVPGTSQYYSCDQVTPAGTATGDYTPISETSLPFPGPPAGTQTIEYWRVVENGTSYWTSVSGTTCTVQSAEYSDYTRTYEQVTEPAQEMISQWHYAPLSRDVSNWRSESNGCIEERATYEIGDYSNVDLTRALDLDIDLVPNSSPDTKWSPMYPNIIYARSKTWWNTGVFTVDEQTTAEDYFNPNVVGSAACPPAARKLATMTGSDMSNYLSTLSVDGSTYHDIGMIWGGRLLSPNGLFASENVDVSPVRPTSRHLIFLTDGETAPLDVSYSSYGLEPLDERRWTESSTLSLPETVEKRFSFACEEVKKRNITVWVISFGTAANPIMEACSGAANYFVADNAAELQATFTSIAKSLGELRVTR